jgi:hypothetical protein
LSNLTKTESGTQPKLNGTLHNDSRTYRDSLLLPFIPEEAVAAVGVPAFCVATLDVFPGVAQSGSP